MKTVAIALEDEVYEAASVEAARARKPLGEFLRDLFLCGLRQRIRATSDGAAGTLQSLWELADAGP